MVNLTIRLNSKGSFSGGMSGTLSTPGSAPAPTSPNPGLSCGSHLVLADLPMASGVGVVPALHSGVRVVNGLGQKVRRRPGVKVHFCVRCNFPIAIYGRLDPCEHVFCLICAKKDVTCYLCDERILRIQKMEVLEGIFVCGAAGCLRSYLSKPEFEWHIRDAHGDLFSVKEMLPSNQLDLLQPHQTVGQGGPSPSPSQLHPSSPPHIRHEGNPSVTPQVTALPGPAEKQLKSHAVSNPRDQADSQLKRKRLEPNGGSGPGREKEEREKDREEREKDVVQSGQREKDREHGQGDREQSLKERDQSQRDRDRDRDRIDRDRSDRGDRGRDWDREFPTRERELWEQQQHTQQQGGANYPHPPPLPLPAFQSHLRQPERLGQVTPPQQGIALNSYPQPFPPFHPQQQDNRITPQYNSSRYGPFLDPRLPVSSEFHENNARARYLQQDGERVRNMPQHLQDGYGIVMDRPGLIMPHFHAEYGTPPIGMMTLHQGVNRFQEGHGGVHPPPANHSNFGVGGDSGMGHPPHMFGWGGPGNFRVPGHPQFMNWQPPQ